jgi:hypothetical protein
VKQLCKNCMAWDWDGGELKSETGEVLRRCRRMPPTAAVHPGLAVRGDDPGNAIVTVFPVTREDEYCCEFISRHKVTTKRLNTDEEN